jgi:hypothetical protein
MMHVNPENWPNHQLPLNDEEALTVAKLILDGKPKSYDEGARRLSRYVIALHQQAEDIEKLLDDAVHDTIPEMAVAAEPPLVLAESEP